MQKKYYHSIRHYCDCAAEKKSEILKQSNRFDAKLIHLKFGTKPSVYRVSWTDGKGHIYYRDNKTLGISEYLFDCIREARAL